MAAEELRQFEYAPTQDEDAVYRLPSAKDEIKLDMVKRIEQDKTKFRSNSRHDVVKIDDGIDSYFNSVNILTGAQGRGKTFTALAECGAIASLHRNPPINQSGPATHMLIFIKRKAYDPTLESTRAIIEEFGCKIVELDYEEAEAYCEQIFALKQLYNLCKRVQYAYYNRQTVPAEFDGVQSQDIELMYTELNVKNFNADWLNTLIVFDDASNSGLFKRPDSFFNTQLKLCRDTNCIYYLTLHGLTTLSPSIKQNTAIIYVFGGLSRERLTIVWRQCAIPLDWNEFMGSYAMLSRTPGARCLVADNITSEWHVE
jgi:hypothetical protein